MRNIFDFDKWKYIAEKKFNAEIKDIKKANKPNVVDNIVVKETENSEPIVYSINGDEIKSIQTEISVGENGEQIGSPKEKSTNITDPQLKLDIKKAAYAIRDIKDRLLAKEILRLTGSDITDTTDNIRKLVDTKPSQDVENIIIGKKSYPNSLALTLKDENIKYIRIPRTKSWEGKYKLTPNDITYLYNEQSHTIGKGEYLLPFLFADTYKNQAYSDTAKGDNYFIKKIGETEIKYLLEVKGSGAAMSFSNNKSINGNGVKIYLDKCESIKNKDNIENIYKTAIAASLLNYTQAQIKNKYDNGYLCIFNESNGNVVKDSNTNRIPFGMLFINISKGKVKPNDIAPEIGNVNKASLLEELKEKITIDCEKDYVPPSGPDFTFSCVVINGEAKIKCLLNKKYFDEIRNIKGDTFFEKPKGKPSKN